MNKIPRFMKEYANYILKEVNENDFLKENYKTDTTNKVNRILQIYEKGLITVHEAISLLNKCE